MTNEEKNSRQSKIRRVARVRSRITGTAERPRIAVYRTLKHISAQLIDDTISKTIVSASDRELKGGDKMKPVDIARFVGKTLASKASEKGIVKAVFDRRDKKYHGRVKAIAEGAREGGLQF